MKTEKRIAAIMFLDIQGYSRLTEPQLRRLFDNALPKMAELVQAADPFHVNTWGDAIVAAAADTLKITSTALELRNYFLNLNWKEMELPRLLARISLHTGPIFMGEDPFSGRQGIVGTQVNLAARVEPVTLPGHVWATDNFISLLEMEDQDAYAWDDLGERSLAKEWGAKRLYRIRFAHEPTELPSLAETVDNDKEKRKPEDRVGLCKKLLTMGDETQKTAALDKLGSVSTLESLSLLVEYARKQSESNEVRDTAFASLVELDNQACVPNFIDMLKSPSDSSHFIGCAIQLLGELGDPRAFDVLAEIAQADDASGFDPRARVAALIALSSLNDARAVPMIERALRSDDDYMVLAGTSAAAHARSKNLSDALADVAKAKDSFDPRRRGAAIEALILAGTGPMPSVFEPISQLALDRAEPPRVRRPALILVATFETDSSREVLTEIAGRLDDAMSARALEDLFDGEDAGRKFIKLYDSKG